MSKKTKLVANQNCGDREFGRLNPEAPVLATWQTYRVTQPSHEGATVAVKELCRRRPIGFGRPTHLSQP